MPGRFPAWLLTGPTGQQQVGSEETMEMGFWPFCNYTHQQVVAPVSVASVESGPSKEGLVETIDGIVGSNSPFGA